MSDASVKSRIRKKIGPGIQRFGYSTGIMSAVAKVRSLNGAVILMYHSIADEVNAQWIDPANHVSSYVFEKQIEYLSKNKNVISLAELVLILQENETIPENTVAITFDDGYLDNLTVAAPILAKYSMPATLFLATGYVDRGETQWIDQIYSIFKFRTRDEIVPNVEMKDLIDLKDPVQYSEIYNELCSELMQADTKQRALLLEKVAGELHPSAIPPRLTMQWDDVKDLITSYPEFELGAHTSEHTDLTSVSIQEAASELEKSKKQIKEKAGFDARFFSFCYGRTSEVLRKTVSTTGFSASCGGEGLDPVIRNGANVYRLPRVPGSSTMKNFDLKVNYINTGLWRKLGK